MEQENRGERPGSQLTTQNQKDNSWYDRSHEEVVKAMRSFVQERSREFAGHFSVEEILRSKLSWETGGGKDRLHFFAPLLRAWDALAYERYEPGSEDEHMAGSTLCSYTGSINGGPTIKLTNPLQVKILDAITEVAGIPHKKGQSEIPIPDKLQHYHEWIFSQEYQELLAKAKAKR